MLDWLLSLLLPRPRSRINTNPDPPKGTQRPQPHHLLRNCQEGCHLPPQADSKDVTLRASTPTLGHGR